MSQVVIRLPWPVTLLVFAVLILVAALFTGVVLGAIVVAFVVASVWAALRWVLNLAFPPRRFEPGHKQISSYKNNHADYVRRWKEQQQSSTGRAEEKTGR